jgi:hypothetical protein
MSEPEPQEPPYAGFYPRDELRRAVPWWVQLTLAGVRKRSLAIFCGWAMALLVPISAFGVLGWSSLTIGFRLVIVFGLMYCPFGAWLYFAAAKWVDRYGRWKA